MQISEYINKLIESKDNDLAFVITFTLPSPSQTKYYRIYHTSITGLVTPILTIYEKDGILYDNVLDIPIADAKDVNLKAFEERIDSK